mgnify:CR=1 FL=1
MENYLQKVVEEYSWLLISGVLLLLFQNTIREVVDGIMIFLGNDYNEDDVVEVDGECCVDLGVIVDVAGGADVVVV